MPYPQRLLATYIAAFYTFCSALPSLADGTDSISANIRMQINPNEITNLEDSSELIFDYLFALNEEQKTPKEVVESLLALCNMGQPNNQPRYGPVFMPHWFIALKNFEVKDEDTLKLLDRATSTFPSQSPIDISAAGAEQFWILANQVADTPTTSPELRAIQTQIVWRLAKSARKNKEYGRKLCTLALELMANTGNSLEGEIRDASSMSFYSFTERPRTDNADGDLLFRDLIAFARIILQAKTQNDASSFESVYNELQLRCSSAQVVEAQKKLVEAATVANFNKKTLDLLSLQLACAYMNVGDLSLSENILAKQKLNAKPIDKLCLAECLRRQKKFVDTERLCKELELISYSFEVRYPSLYVANAKAIRAQSLIDQKKFSDALPLLEAADKWFGNAVAHDNMELNEFQFATKVLPDEVRVLSNLETVYQRLGRARDAQLTSKVLTRVRSEQLRNALLIEKDALTGNAMQASVENKRSIEQAKRLVTIALATETSRLKRTNQLLDFAEIYIRSGKPKSAEVCIEACGSKNLDFTKNDMNVHLRTLVDRIFIAEAKGDIKQAHDLFKSLPTTGATKTTELEARVAEAEARLALLEGDFRQAEEKSQKLERLMDSMPNTSEHEYNQTPRDKFVAEHAQSIMDRVQILNHLQKYKSAARLARWLLVRRSYPMDQFGFDAASNLAFAYQNDQHTGLASTFIQEAIYKDFASNHLAPSLYKADAKERMADLSELRANPVRARRYRAEAKEIREQLKEIVSEQKRN